MSYNNPYMAPSELATGGYINYEPSAITVTFMDVHYSLSTGQLNGGFHHTLGIRNQQLTFMVNTEKELPGGSAAEYLSMEFQHLDLPIHFCTALMTSATMERHVYTKIEQDDTIVETIVTGGFECTTQRAGTGYHYVEKDGEFHQPGTLNILVFTNKALTDGAMTKALITITEAKTAAFQDAQVASTMNPVHVATGTATDGIILTIDTNGEILTDAGTFSLFGDTLAKAVYIGVQRALEVSKNFPN